MSVAASMTHDRLCQLIRQNREDLNEALRQRHHLWADAFGRRRESLKKIAARIGLERADFEAAERGEMS